MRFWKEFDRRYATRSTFAIHNCNTVKAGLGSRFERFFKSETGFQRIAGAADAVWTLVFEYDYLEEL